MLPSPHLPCMHRLPLSSASFCLALKRLLCCAAFPFLARPTPPLFSPRAAFFPASAAAHTSPARAIFFPAVLFISVRADAPFPAEELRSTATSHQEGQICAARAFLWPGLAGIHAAMDRRRGSAIGMDLTPLITEGPDPHPIIALAAGKPPEESTATGFVHAAFTLGYEAGIHKGGIDGNVVPPGALITIVQKGLQYIELEANTDENDEEVEKDFALLEPLEIITKDVEELQQIVKKRKRERLQIDLEKDKGKETECIEEHEQHPGGEREREHHDKEKEQEREKDKTERDKAQEKEKEREKQHTERTDKLKHEEDSLAGGGPTPMDVSTGHEIFSADVTVLEGHSSEVFACAWSPAGSLLASGSGDSTARIWTIPDGPCGSIQSSPTSVHVLKHFKGRTNEKSKDVTTLDWNGEGTLLATGSYDGQARIWSRDGELKQTLFKHKGPIFSLKWNKKGDFLLSGSVDKTAIVWDTKTWECKQQFEFHSAPTLDVDWRNNTSFATCSTDNMIYVCKIGDARPVKSFSGHQSEVNAIKWDPTGCLLASCSDDWTAKIWSLKQDKCVYDFKEHTKEIYTIRWSPTGPGTNNPNQQLLLASASFDSSIKLWEVEHGRLLYSLAGHRQPVYSVAFSPDGEYLASGSLDQSLHIWSVKEGRILKTYRGSGGIFEVCWNKEGSKIAACFSNNTVCVMDFRM